jgi:WD40 repeat protein
MRNLAVLVMHGRKHANFQTQTTVDFECLLCSITDVCWSPPGSALIAAAMNNGGVVIYDLEYGKRLSSHTPTAAAAAAAPAAPTATAGSAANASSSGALGGLGLRMRAQLQARTERVMVEHTRTVNRVCWHPGEGNVLLSVSTLIASITSSDVQFNYQATKCQVLTICWWQ